MMRKLIPAAAFLFLLLAAPRLSGASPGVLEAVVKIYTVHTRPDYDSPWRTHSPRSSTS